LKFNLGCKCKAMNIYKYHFQKLLSVNAANKSLNCGQKCRDILMDRYLLHSTN
jgi:hypothetical protein